MFNPCPCFVIHILPIHTDTRKRSLSSSISFLFLYLCLLSLSSPPRRRSVTRLVRLFIWAKPRLVGCILSYMRHDHEAWLYDMALALLELARFISPTYDGGGLFAQFVAAMTTTATPPAWCQVSCVGYHMSGISIISALRMFSLHGSNLDRSLFSAAVHTLTSSTSRGTIIYYGAMMPIPLYRYALSCI